MDGLSEIAKTLFVEREYEIETLRRMSMPRGFFYLGTPYTKYEAGREAAARHAAVIVQALTECDIPVYSPIVHWHEVDKYGQFGDDPKFWLSVNIPMLSCARGLIVARLPGWSESTGLAKEREFAKANLIQEHHLLLPNIFYAN